MIHTGEITGMTRVPISIGAIHFIGIGGIGMSGIAEVMRNLGYHVQGSDTSDSANVKRLRSLGIPVAIGQSAENLGEAQVVVYSSAVKSDNVELAAARRAGLPIVRRAEMLAELMRLKRCVAIAGTHGKTTTTTMVAALLDGGGLDPTVVNGGIINAYGTNARLGSGDWMVVEADESDGTFLRLPAMIAVVTNVDPEHLDFYGEFERVKSAFQSFVENLPFYGFAVMCTDHPEVQAMVARVRDRRIITYGFNPQADARAVSVSFSEGAAHFDAVFRDRRKDTEIVVKDFHLPMPGEHNVSNAVAAIAVAREIGIPADAIRKALSQFGGVKRRFTRVGTWNGAALIDDYGHHPVEIAAVLKAARQAFSGPLVAIVQPHRYTRLRDLFDQFCTSMNGADTAIVAPVYAAGEAPIEGINRDTLAEGLRAHGHKRVLTIEGPDDLRGLIDDLAKPGGAVVFLGAGSITTWANGMEAALKEKGGVA
jgi:UDP-N-acetylmuramate--alanine ligase